jgi:hypothetical protein
MLADGTRRKTMTTFNASSKHSVARARAIAIELNRGIERPAFRTRNAMMLFAVAMLATAMATHAFAAGRGGGSLGADGGFHGDHMQGGFQGSIIDQAPSTPAPTFNPSNPYAVPQSPENSISPASPGSIFGDGANPLLVSAVSVKSPWGPSTYDTYRLERRGYYGTPYGGGPQFGNGGGDQYGYGPGYSYARQAPDRT